VVAALLLLLIDSSDQDAADIPRYQYPGGQCDLEYTGLPADQIAQRIVYARSERSPTTVDNIEHIESTPMTASA